MGITSNIIDIVFVNRYFRMPGIYKSPEEFVNGTIFVYGYNFSTGIMQSRTFRLPKSSAFLNISVLRLVSSLSSICPV